MIHRLCLLHPIDPRVDPRHPVELRLRALIASVPRDFALVVVGVDAVGDLRPGRPVDVVVAGRTIAFLPVSRAGAGARAYAAGLVRRLPALRRALRPGPASLSVHDVTWMPAARLAGHPIVLVVHDDPRAGRVAGHLTLREALRETVALRLATRIVGCDLGFVERCRDGHPATAAKTEYLAFPVDLAAGAAAPLGDEVRITRLWERHRRLFDVQAVHRGRPAAA